MGIFDLNQEGFIYFLCRKYTMSNILNTKTRMITEHVDNMVPETADIELNFALKRYYLGQFLTETEVEDIIKQREKEIEEMCGQMELTNYEQLNPTEEEVKAFVEYTQERIDAVMKEREEAIKRITEQEKLYTYAEAPVEESKGI